MIASLEHPCIVPVYDFGWAGEQPYIVMRYMSGGTLEHRLGKGEVKLSEIAHIFKRVSEALDAAHLKNIIRRDVKPWNILFDFSGESFLSDFGIARSQAIKDQDGAWLVGTPEYMSPEQIQRSKIDGRSDIHAVGVVLYRLLTGKLPFMNDSVSALINAHADLPMPDVRELKSNLPAAGGRWSAKPWRKPRMSAIPPRAFLPAM